MNCNIFLLFDDPYLSVFYFMKYHLIRKIVLLAMGKESIQNLLCKSQRAFYEELPKQCIVHLHILKFAILNVLCKHPK